MEGVLFIGLQASGKSSFFLQQFNNSHLRLNMDMLKTRYREQFLFKACLEAKQPCVIDNTNPRKQDRIAYIEAFKAHRFKVIGYFFESDFAACTQRNQRRSGRAQIPEAGLKATAKKLERPMFEEGFDELYFVRIENDEFKIEVMNDEI